jgi:hypothetical protein
MKRIKIAPSVGLCAAFLGLAVGFVACQSHQSSLASQQSQTSQSSANDLKIVDNPSGGQFAYGSLTGQGSKVDALVYMLRQVHDHFGDKPQVGKFFQSRDGNSLATFFTLNARKMGGQAITGLVIVSMPGQSAPQVAVLYDSSKRFVSTEPALLKSLSAAWQHGTAAPSGEAASPSSAPGQVAAPQPKGGPEHLTKVTGGDHSAVVGLPDGWRLTHVAGGTLMAEGTRGEVVNLGLIYQQIIDPNNPKSQSITRMPNYSRTPHLICALNGDLFSAFVNVSNQVRHNNGKSQGTYKLISSKNLPSDGGAAAPVQAIFTVDMHDGVGPRKGSARIGVMALRGAPTWAMTVSTSNIPVKYADAEEATLMAVIRSYSQDANVIAREGAADLDRIHQVGVRTQIQVDAANQRREQSSKAYEEHRQQLNQNSSEFNQHMGNIDWSSKLTQDYILDRSVVKDNDYDATATTGNKFADSLVRTNPNRFEIVQNQDLIRGRDY